MTVVVASDHATRASFDVASRNGVVNVGIRGQLVRESAGDLADVLDGVATHPGDLVQLDARGVDCIDCSALLVIDHAKRALAEAGVTLWVVSPSLCVRALLDLADAAELLAPGDQSEPGDRETGFRHVPC